MKALRLTRQFLILIGAMALAQSKPMSVIGLPRDARKPAQPASPLADAGTQTKIVENYGKLPLSFEVNEGQTDGTVKFLSRGSGYTLFLTGDEAVFSFDSAKSKDDIGGVSGQVQAKPEVPISSAVLRMKLVRANRSVKVTGVNQLPGKSNYFIGNNQKRWHSNVPTYAKVKYRGIYPAIDLVYYGNQRQLEYDFVVSPGGDPHRIQFHSGGANRISRDEYGDLVFQTPAGEVRWRRPIVYQEKNGVRQEIAATYVVKNRNQVGFEVADYDKSRPLYIDPLVYSTYLGGSGNDSGVCIAVDSSGSAYIVGKTASPNFPTVNPLQPTYAGDTDAFVAKFNAGGSALVYSTYLGGSGDDEGYGCAVDSSGDVYVTGITGSSDFPTKNPFQPTYGGNDDAFVAELNATGSTLLYSTYLGGNGYDYGFTTAVDNLGDAYVTGTTMSTNFPTTPGAFQTTCSGECLDAFVAKFNSTGSALVYSTFLGGTAGNQGFGIALDSSGDAYVTGLTDSIDFPTVNPLQPYGGGEDAFVTQVNSSGSALVYSTYLGGDGNDVGQSIAVDSSGNAYVTGYTNSTNFPTAHPLQPALGGGNDAFVAEVNSSGSALVYSTYLGGSGDDYGQGVTLDSSGNAYVTGYTDSTNFPTLYPLQPVNGGGYDAFVAQLNPSGSAFVYSTYLGGSGTDSGNRIAVDSSGNAYVIGTTNSTNFPTVNPFQSANGGSYDAFVAEIEKASANVLLAPSNLNFGNQTVGIASNPLVSTLTNDGVLSLTVTSIKVIGTNSTDFTQRNNCTSVPPGQSCKISVTFTPSGTGNETASVSVVDNAPNSPQALPLAGNGVLPAVTLSPTSLTFPTQVVFTTSPAQKVTLTNTGLGVLKITAAGISGPFGVSTNCTATLAAGLSCTANVVFKPTTKGTLNGDISITDNAPGSPQKVPMSGTGTFVQLSPTSVNFGNQPVHTTSAPKYIALSNKGDAPVNFTGSGISITGTNASDFAEANNCGTSIASGATCYIKVTFTPSQQGKRTADVSVSDDGGGSPQMVPLSGTGTP